MKAVENLLKRAAMAFALVGVVAMAGCSGGGGSSSLTATKSVSGVAAAGAPIVGKAYLKDSADPANTLVTDIATDGSFSFDVSDSKFTPPFILQAQGTVGDTSYTLHSMSTGTGTANINPITNLAVAEVTGKDPEAVFTDPVGNDIKTAINTQAVTDAISKIKTMLQPLLAVYGAQNVDPLKDTIAANNQGVDGVLDQVKINVTAVNGTPQVSIDNKMDGTSILAAQSVTQAVQNAAETQAAIATNADTTGMTDDAINLAAIALQIKAFADELNKGAGGSLDSFYAVNFGINNGLDRADTMKDMKGPEKKITGISPLTILEKIQDSNSTAGFDYKIEFKAYFADGTTDAPDDHFIFTSEGGTWKLKGNDKKSRVRVNPKAIKWVQADGTVSVATGLEFEVDDPGLNGIATALITGPGLPAGGITMSKPQSTVTNLAIDTAYQSTSAITDNWQFYPVDDTTITSAFASANAPFKYTFIVKDANGNTIETRTKTIGAGPLTGTVLAGGSYFPAISSITSHALTTITGTNSLNITYTVPTAYPVSWMDAWVSFWSAGGDWYDTTLLVNSTQATINYGAAPTPLYGASIGISAQDQFKRNFQTEWIFN
jgi:hypothetical protein